MSSIFIATASAVPDTWIGHEVIVGPSATGLLAAIDRHPTAHRVVLTLIDGDGAHVLDVHENVRVGVDALVGAGGWTA